MDVTVSIVNHEHRDAVLASLRALEDDPARQASVELIVVDNVSQDGSVDAIREAFPDAEVIARTQRAGYGANHNVALAAANGRYALLLNDDTFVTPATIDRLVAALDADPGLAVAAPTVRHQHRGGRADAVAAPVAAAGRARRAAPRGAARARGWRDRVGDGLRADGPHRRRSGRSAASTRSSSCTPRRSTSARGWSTPATASPPSRTRSSSTTGRRRPAWSRPERAVEMARSRRRYWHKHYGLPARLAAQAVVAAQFAAMAFGARRDRARARPLLLQASVSLTGRPGDGLRERAAAFNRSRAHR